MTPTTARTTWTDLDPVKPAGLAQCPDDGGADLGRDDATTTVSQTGMSCCFAWCDGPADDAEDGADGDGGDDAGDQQWVRCSVR